MSSEIPKAYEPQAVEEKWYQFWLDQKCFLADPKSPKPAYSIVIPPPNVTGMLHMGHVLNNTIQDILARKARMDGKEVLWLPGTDHAGIATQAVVEKALRKQGLMKHREVEPGTLHHGPGLFALRAAGLRGAVQEGADLSRQAHGQLGPGGPDRGFR